MDGQVLMRHALHLDLPLNQYSNKMGANLEVKVKLPCGWTGKLCFITYQFVKIK